MTSFWLVPLTAPQRTMQSRAHTRVVQEQASPLSADDELSWITSAPLMEVGDQTPRESAMGEDLCYEEEFVVPEQRVADWRGVRPYARNKWPNPLRGRNYRIDLLITRLFKICKNQTYALCAVAECFIS